jgi:hypothetical protein
VGNLEEKAKSGVARAWEFLKGKVGL